MRDLAPVKREILAPVPAGGELQAAAANSGFAFTLDLWQSLNHPARQ
jgi:hypothetical protein